MCGHLAPALGSIGAAGIGEARNGPGALSPELGLGEKAMAGGVNDCLGLVPRDAGKILQEHL